MVRERAKKTSARRPAKRRAKPATAPRAGVGSIWETPHMKQVLVQPVGTPINLTKAEARAILDEMLKNPRPYNAKEAERAHRELRRIRRMWGSVMRDLDG
jgi:hypothetical protein